MNKNTVIHHSADYDGLFSREIAKKFLPPDTQFIGWDFGDKPITGKFDTVYVIDLPCDQPFGFKFENGVVSPAVADKYATGYKLNGLECNQLIWIDHHKSAIDHHPKDIPGYRIDGVAACRLAWQWFALHAEWDPREQHPPFDLPSKLDFVDRRVTEPLAIRLAGEYDVWDHRDSRDVPFQFGLDTEIDSNEFMFDWLLKPDADIYVQQIVAQGKCAMACYKRRDAEVMKSRSFLAQFEGLKFLCLNVARCNSQTFDARDIPETGHDALAAFYWNGSHWSVSLYHAKHRTDLDLSAIAVKYGGGGHRGACGFRVGESTFINAFIKCS